MKRTWLRHRLACEVVVHTTTDQSIAGVLEEVARDGLILRAARFLADGGSELTLAGETYVPRSKIHFVQVTAGQVARV